MFENTNLDGSPRDKQAIRTVYERVCRDSRYRSSMADAARLTARILKIDPLDVWLSMGIRTMEEIAQGDKPQASLYG